MSYFQSALNAFSGSFISKTIDGSVTVPSACYWWSTRVFETDLSIKSFLINDFKLS